MILFRLEVILRCLCFEKGEVHNYSKLRCSFIDVLLEQRYTLALLEVF